MVLQVGAGSAVQISAEERLAVAVEYSEAVVQVVSGKDSGVVD